MNVLTKNLQFQFPRFINSDIVMFQLGINETPFYKNIFAEIECFKLMLLIVVVAMTQCQFHIFTLMTAETRQ